MRLLDFFERLHETLPTIGGPESNYETSDITTFHFHVTQSKYQLFFSLKPIKVVVIIVIKQWRWYSTRWWRILKNKTKKMI